MSQKTKIRLWDKIAIDIYKVIFVVLLTLSCSMPVLAASVLKDYSTESSNKLVTISKSDVAENQNLENRIEPKEHMSTMELMITGKLTVRGDKDIARQKRLARIAKQKRLARIARQKQLEKIKKEKRKKDVILLARLIEGEVGNQNDETQQVVAQVVMNRVSDNDFPNTLEGVIYDEGQYACINTNAFNSTPSEKAMRNAKAVINNSVITKVPENCVFQAMFRQGSGVWNKCGDEYICYK